MTIEYSYGCTTDGITIDGIPFSDLGPDRQRTILIDLLTNDYTLDESTMYQCIGDIVESQGVLTHTHYCEQCGDTAYTYELDADIEDRKEVGNEPQ